MFEGTDLSVAFGSLNGDTGGGYENPQKMPPVQAPPPPMPELTVPKSDKMYTQNDYYNDTAESTTSTKKPKTKMVHADGFWDRVGAKKMEVAKVIILALIIVLAFSLDHMITHYLSNFFGQSFLTDTQEFLVRLAYPVTIVIVIWLLKSI